MRSKVTYLMAALLVLVMVLGLASVALASASYVQQIPAEVQDKSCNLCHTSSIPALNDKGQAWVDAGKDWSVFAGAAQPAAEEKPAAAQEQAAASEEQAEEELPNTGGNPYIYVGIGAVLVAAGLLLGKKRAYREE